MKDSLWSVDLFRCESIRLKSHWVLVVMDQFTRRLTGFGVHAGQNGASLDFESTFGWLFLSVADWRMFVWTRRIHRRLLRYASVASSGIVSASSKTLVTIA
jgi:hypothetical protein